VRRTAPPILVFILLFSASFAEETTFHRIKAAGPKGEPVNATLTFSDDHKAIEINPVKGKAVSIPYSEIDNVSYEYTKKHRVTEGSMITAPVGIGAVAMLTKSKVHWLEIHYIEEDIRKTYLVRMDKHNYLRILEALKKHTGKDAEVLGNADKRR
jgi:hypothetical protein